MEPHKFSISRGTLESWLKERTDDSFPPYDRNRAEVSYPERYDRVKEQLSPYHQVVEKGALLRSAVEWMQKVTSSLSDSEPARVIAEISQQEPFLYLNNHGAGHVENVIAKASDMLVESKCELTSYEGYLLLCALQFHDVGNVFGRKDHEIKCREIMSKMAGIIKDSAERNAITRIAAVHSGCWNGQRDTIEQLVVDGILFGQTVRERLLASILRFADELADDSTRADRIALADHIMPKEAEIYHWYSQSLHSVKIDKTSVDLGFEFESPLAVTPLTKDGNERFLLDEIYYRTRKMELERRYCMRFTRPFISIDRIKVEIVIQSATNPLDREKITYSLGETGYPTLPRCEQKLIEGRLRSGKKFSTYLKRKWSLE